MTGPGSDLREQGGRRAFDLVARSRGSGCRAGTWRGRRGAHELLLDVGRDRVLPAVGLLVHLLPFEPDDVDEQALGEAVAAHDRDGDLAALRGEPEGAVVEQLGVAVLDQAVHGLGDRRGREPEALDEARRGSGSTPSSSISRMASRYSSVASWCSATPAPFTPDWSCRLGSCRRGHLSFHHGRSGRPPTGDFSTFAAQNLHSRPSSANMVSTRCL